jgi:hypothetical protein
MDNKKENLELKDIKACELNEVCCIEDIEIINDSTASIELTKFRGFAQMADKKNGNKRIYPEKVLKNALNSIQDDIKKGKITALLGHPSFLGEETFDKVVAIITKAELVDKKVFIEGRFVNNDATKSLIAYKEAGGFLGISARGYGSAVYDKKQDAYIIGEDYAIRGWDFVIDPAVPDARVLHMENKDLKGNLHKFKEVVMDIKTLQDLRYNYPELVGILDKEKQEIKDKLSAEVSSLNDEINKLNDVVVELNDKVASLEKEKEEIVKAKDEVEKELNKMKFDAAINALLADHKYKEFITIPAHINTIEDAEAYVKAETEKFDKFKAAVVTDNKEVEQIIVEEPQIKEDNKEEVTDSWALWNKEALELGRM